MILVSGFLLRAPLLPVRALRAPVRALTGHPLGAAAIELASPELAAALARGGAAPRAALARYARRAAFRPTPAGLFAGVAMGRLGAHTSIRTGDAGAILAPSWAAMAALGRALLDEPVLRGGVRLRQAPSLLVWGGEVSWIETTSAGPRWSSAELDQQLAALLDAAGGWTSWRELRRLAAGPEPATDEEADELLLALVDRGLLHHDLQPPLVGPPAGAWMRRRVAELSVDDERSALLEPVAHALAEAEDPSCALSRRRSALGRLPGAASAPGLNAVLRLQASAVLDRRAVERAAALAPLLFRLQEAMSPPVSERVLDTELTDALDGISEVVGAGALSWPALAGGGYGASLRELDEEENVAGAPRPALLAYLAGRLAAASPSGVLELDVAALEPLLPEIGAPPSFELFLAPAAEPRRTAPGTGWLLGLHAPAGATFGRFAAALGEPAAAALAELAAAERAARPEELALDVAYAASPALADLGAHPPVRAAALALSGWPDGAAVTPQQLELVVDPAVAPAPVLRVEDGTPVAPSPLHRVRSTTAPRGLMRLACGWSFARQHAPWAFGWGPLAFHVDRLPRVVLDGFVVAPASWRIPERAALRRRGGMQRWRRELQVPRAVQVGEGDELLHIDLMAPGAAAELERFAGGRAWELWPPLDATVDAGGRRTEAVVAVVVQPDGEELHRLRAGREAGRVPPPAESPPAAGWTTFRIYGAEERQALVLHDAVAPAIAGARAAGEIDGWFFLPYVEPGTGRHHLRVRVHGGGSRFAKRLERLLAGARELGDVTTVEIAEYFRESARYGGPHLMPAVEALFEASSDLALAVIEAESTAAEPWPAGERAAILARACDALARGLGLGIGERHELARDRWNAAAPAGEDPAPLRQLYRRRSRALGALLGGSEVDGLTSPLGALAERAAGLTDRLALRPALPALLHLGAVRLAGAHADEEAAGYFLWERTLDGLRARGARDA